MSEECPICLNTIDTDNNKVITNCGHTFHCICLMKNIQANGFMCPCCRRDLKIEKDDKKNTIEADFGREITIHIPTGRIQTTNITARIQTANIITSSEVQRVFADNHQPSGTSSYMNNRNYY
jgi:hypothetical protein